MTLLQTIQALELVASQQPGIHMIVENDIFRLNAVSDARYGVFGWTQGQHSSSIDASTITYNFSLFYVDRLTSDKSNQVEIQSVGIETLDNILRMLDEMGIFVDTSYTFTTFNQRFLDECAGVFCNVALTTPLSFSCPEDFAEMEKFNTLIY